MILTGLDSYANINLVTVSPHLGNKCVLSSYQNSLINIAVETSLSDTINGYLSNSTNQNKTKILIVVFTHHLGLKEFRTR